MSIVGDFVKGASAAAMPMLGTEPISIAGGPSLSAVLNELSTDRDYEAGGQAPARGLMAVIKTADWLLGYASAEGTYLGKDAAVRGITMTVARISKGAEFVEIELADEEAAR
jgi:hypothetical protein